MKGPSRNWSIENIRKDKMAAYTPLRRGVQKVPGMICQTDDVHSSLIPSFL
jgi:hypothetical protein